MEVGKYLEDVLKKDSLSMGDVYVLLDMIGVKAGDAGCRILSYKKIERALLCHYRETYGIDLSPRIYDINDIHGLILFLYIKKHGTPVVDGDLETFFEKLFFGSCGEEKVVELKEENERLASMNRELREKLREVSNMCLDKGFEEGGFRSVDSEVLARMEKELVELKSQVDFEHSAILEAWYRLGEEYIKNK